MQDFRKSLATLIRSQSMHLPKAPQKSKLRRGLRQPRYLNWKWMKRAHFSNRPWTTKSWCSCSQITLCRINHQLHRLTPFPIKRANILGQEIRMQYRWYQRIKEFNHIRPYRHRETVQETFINLVWEAELNQSCVLVIMALGFDIVNQAMTARWLQFETTLRHRYQTTR